MIEVLNGIWPTMVDWPWKTVGAMITALAGGVWALYTFVNERREDRKWKQVEFLLELNQRFLDSPEIRDCIVKLDDEAQHADLARIFADKRATLQRGEVQLVDKFHSMLQFFSNLYRCYAMKTLTLEQIDLFGWYLYRINSLEALRIYCRNNGYANVIALAEELERYVYNRA